MTQHLPLLSFRATNLNSKKNATLTILQKFKDFKTAAF